MVNVRQRLVEHRYRPGKSRWRGGHASRRFSRSKNPSLRKRPENKGGGGWLKWGGRVEREDIYVGKIRFKVLWGPYREVRPDSAILVKRRFGPA